MQYTELKIGYRFCLKHEVTLTQPSTLRPLFKRYKSRTIDIKLFYGREMISYDRTDEKDFDQKLKKHLNSTDVPELEIVKINKSSVVVKITTDHYTFIVSDATDQRYNFKNRTYRLEFRKNPDLKFI